MKQSLPLKNLLLRAGFMASCRALNRGGRVAILRYHAVVDSADNFYASPSICVSPSVFETQVRYIARHYNVIDLDTVATCLRERTPFPPRSVVFTFDDGYRDNVEAARILERYGATGTFYIAAGCVENREPLWLFEVIYLLGQTRATAIEIGAEAGREVFPLKSPVQRRAAIRRVTERIKSNDRTAREAIRRQLRDQTPDVADLEEKSQRVMLTWDQVREIAGLGMTIAGHTMTHLNLPNATPSEAEAEINECRQTLSDAIHGDVRHFSYPNGGNYAYYTPAVVDMVRRAGYLTATTSNNAVVRRCSSPLELERVRVTEHISEVAYQIDCEPLLPVRG